MDIFRHFVITLLVVQLPAILARNCDDGWEEYGDMCYYFSYNITAFRDDAQRSCIGKGGVLASIPNKDVNDYLYSQMSINSTNSESGGNSHWIGLVGTYESNKRSEWRWLNGNFTSDIAWYSNEPSSEGTVCGKLGGYGTFDLALGNIACTRSIMYICEKETDHTNQDWVKNGRHWYFFSKDTSMTRNFIQSFNECLSMNASLAIIETQDELDFIRNRIRIVNVSTSEGQHYWIGLTTLHWLDHSPITYTNFWLAKELNVNNPCVYLHTSNNKWESDCKQTLRFICQKAKPIPSTSTTVTTKLSTATSTSKMTNQTTPEPPNNIVVSDTDDNVHMTTESSSTSNTVGNSGIMGKVQMDKDKMPMIAGIVAGIVIAIIIVVVIVLLLYRRRKLSHARAEIALVDDNFSPSSADDTIQPYGTSAVVEDNDMQPYGTSEIQPYGTSDMKTIEDNALNHKYESEGVSPFYDDEHINDKNRAVTPPDVKQQLPVYAVVNKPKDKLDPNRSKGGSERTTKSSGSSSCDNDSLTINTNINNMPVYAVVDIVKKKAANAKEWNAEQRSCKSADDANTPIVETNKKEILVDDVLPVYAVVDKTKKNLASVPKQIKDQQNQPEKQNINTISVPTDGPIYAVVDKNKRVQSPKPIPPAKPSAIEIQNTEIDDMSTHIYSECENINNTVGYAEFDIQEGTEESNKFSIAAENDYAEVQFKD